MRLINRPAGGLSDEGEAVACSVLTYYKYVHTNYLRYAEQEEQAQVKPSRDLGALVSAVGVACREVSAPPTRALETDRNRARRKRPLWFSPALEFMTWFKAVCQAAGEDNARQPPSALVRTGRELSTLKPS